MPHKLNVKQPEFLKRIHSEKIELPNAIREWLRNKTEISGKFVYLLTTP